ncbi:unnamed protein product [Blepharisma stoltei]|uniref:Uncharacterized protein n=1 Tax=Blepharisma stoltei TaxID=1481888 RepID=A0AAU9KLQ6_9CILI|nr:unnamed protein product [Blepharisma stoltei]
MEIQIENSRLLKFYQIFFLQLNKLVSLIDPKTILSLLSNVSPDIVSEIESSATENIRAFMKISKQNFEAFLLKYDIPQMLDKLEFKEIENNLIEECNVTSEAAEILRSVFSGKEASFPQARIGLERFVEQAKLELKRVREENYLLERKRENLYDEINELRQIVLEKCNN